MNVLEGLKVPVSLTRDPSDYLLSAVELEILKGTMSTHGELTLVEIEALDVERVRQGTDRLLGLTVQGEADYYADCDSFTVMFIDPRRSHV